MSGTFNGRSTFNSGNTGTPTPTSIGAVTGPASSTNNDIALFNGATGQIIKDSGVQISTDGTFAANSDSLVPTQKATVTYVAATITGSDHARGAYDASVNLFPSTGGSGAAGAIKMADYWFISVAGTLGGEPAAVGSTLYALTDTPGQTAANWQIINSDYVVGPASATNNAIALFDGVTGKLIKDSAVLLSAKANSGANSDITSLSALTSETITNAAGTVLETLTQTSGASKTTLINTVNTTDATVTTIHTITLATDTTYTIRGLVRARRTGGASGSVGDSAGYSFFATVKNISGTASLVSTSDVVSKEDQAGWDVTIDATGATIRIRVTGASANNITWDLLLEQFGR